MTSVVMTGRRHTLANHRYSSDRRAEFQNPLFNRVVRLYDEHVHALLSIL